MRIRKPWTEWDDEINFKSLPGAMGVFELADEDRKTIYIGKASGKSPFGLRGELFLCFADTDRLEDANWIHPKMGQQINYLNYLQVHDTIHQVVSRVTD